MTVTYKMDGNTAIITMDNGENRFNPDFIQSFLDVLAEIEQNDQARTMVVTSAHPKIFSNGIDLEWLAPIIQKKDGKTAKAFFYQLNQLFKKTLNMPIITMAAINGHAFAGGAIWACAFDFRFMRTERGYFCFPEVDLGIPFLPGMLALLAKAIPRQKMEEMALTGCRLTAEECVQHNIVTQACHTDKLMDTILSYARGIDKKPAVVRQMKLRMYQSIFHALEVEDMNYIESEIFNI